MVYHEALDWPNFSVLYVYFIFLYSIFVDPVYVAVGQIIKKHEVSFHNNADDPCL